MTFIVGLQSRLSASKRVALSSREPAGQHFDGRHRRVAPAVSRGYPVPISLQLPAASNCATISYAAPRICGRRRMVVPLSGRCAWAASSQAPRSTRFEDLCEGGWRLAMSRLMRHLRLGGESQGLVSTPQQALSPLVATWALPSLGQLWCNTLAVGRGCAGHDTRTRRHQPGYDHVEITIFHIHRLFRRHDDLEHQLRVRGHGR